MSNGTIRSREYLEEAFSHGKIPTQCDFLDLIATFVSLSGDLTQYINSDLTVNYIDIFNDPVMANSTNWTTAYTVVCANSAAWFNVGEFVPLSGYATVTGPLTTQSIDLSGGSITNIGVSSLGFTNGTTIKSNVELIRTTGTTINYNYFPSGLIYNLSLTGLKPNTRYITVAKVTMLSGSQNGITNITNLGFSGGGGIGPVNEYASFIPISSTINFDVVVSNMSPYGAGGYGIIGISAINTEGILVDTRIITPFISASCGNSDQWCDAYRVSLSSLTGVSINGVTADYSNHFASFTGLTFGDTATITAINLNGIAQPPDITRTVNLNVPLSSYVPLSGNVTITNPISVDGCITADCITGLTSINLDGGDITNWSDVSAYYDLAGMDILPGDLLHIEYSPSAYDVVTPVPGLTAYPLSGHLAGIDSAITCISGVSALTFTNTTVAPTPVKTLSNYLLIKVNGSDMYLPLYT